MPYDPARFLTRLRSALPSAAAAVRQRGSWAELGRPWLVALAVLLGSPLLTGFGGPEAEGPRPQSAPAPATPQPQATAPATHTLDKAAWGQRLREGSNQTPQPWPDLPPAPPLALWPLLAGTPQAEHGAAGSSSTAQRLAQWGKRQLEGG